MPYRAGRLHLKTEAEERVTRSKVGSRGCEASPGTPQKRSAELFGSFAIPALLAHLSGCAPLFVPISGGGFAPPANIYKPSGLPANPTLFRCNRPGRGLA